MTTAPLVTKIRVNIPAAAQAAAATTIAFRAPHDGSISKVLFFANANITGANTDTRKHAIVNKGQSGSGTTEMAGLQYNSTVNATAYDEKTIPLSGTAANLLAVAGDLIVVASTAVGNGLADPGGHVEIEYNRS